MANRNNKLSIVLACFTVIASEVAVTCAVVPERDAIVDWAAIGAGGAMLTRRTTTVTDD